MMLLSAQFARLSFLALALRLTTMTVRGATKDYSNRKPWWKAATANFEAVDEDYSWRNRQTGVTDTWKSALGVWSHYNRTALETAHHTHSAPIPWTDGRMLKSLRQINATTFELHSIYEPSAVGHWLKGFMRTRPQDGLEEHSYVFHKTPYRVAHLPRQRLPDRWPTDASTSRVTIVQPNAATVSCPRWLPDDAKQSEQLVTGGKYEKSPTFAELWLGETSEGIAEGSKIGLFVEYNGVTGELIQVFLMRQGAMPADLHVLDPATATLDLAQLDATLQERQWRPWTDQSHLRTAAAWKLASGAPIDAVVTTGGWKRVTGRVVQTESPAGPESACAVRNLVLPNNAADAEHYYSPIPANERDLYWDIRCPEQGVYFYIPKTFHPTHLSEDVCLELGCLTPAGGLHRVMVYGSRSQGALHTTVYERWHDAGEKE
jgi:hypothetical protein